MVRPKNLGYLPGAMRKMTRYPGEKLAMEACSTFACGGHHKWRVAGLKFGGKDWEPIHNPIFCTLQDVMSLVEDSIPLANKPPPGAKQDLLNVSPWYGIIKDCIKSTCLLMAWMLLLLLFQSCLRLDGWLDG
jgi:hypothetical protein